MKWLLFKGEIGIHAGLDKALSHRLLFLLALHLYSPSFPVCCFCVFLLSVRLALFYCMCVSFVSGEVRALFRPSAFTEGPAAAA